MSHLFLRHREEVNAMLPAMMADPAMAEAFRAAGVIGAPEVWTS